ncbi:hypothetical protein ACIQM0_14075 [Streptomyces sp. NPDC091387]|uniref:hypothetical protein n=1 Tax=Streptomyces sp. NPDC091387 TaxID=3365998 RepID=UPI0037F729FB
MPAPHGSGGAEGPGVVLHETADVLAQHRYRTAPRENAARRKGDELVSLIDAPHADGTSLRLALHSFGLSDQGPYQVITARPAHEDDAGAAADALTEALHHDPDRPFTVGRLTGGTAVAVVQGEPGDSQGRLHALWPVLEGCSTAGWGRRPPVPRACTAVSCRRATP